MSEVTIAGQTPAYVAESKAATTAVIVIHEVWGLNDQIRSVADRLAAEGFLALAPDLLVGTGIAEQMTPELIAQMFDPVTRDLAQPKLRAAMAPIQSPEFGAKTVERLKACFDYLMSQPGITKVVAMGFCFGGSYSFSLACAEPKLAAAIVFYGHAPAEDQLAKINCPVYGYYGQTDTALVDALPELAATMKRLGKHFDYKVYPNVGHAFFNDTNPVTYNKETADDAWAKVLATLKSL